MNPRNVFAPYGANYPAISSSEWANAPFNQREPEEKSFECNVTETLARRVVITTNDYETSICNEESESMCHPEDEYKSQCFPVLTLIAELKGRVEKELSGETDKRKAKGLQRLLQACEGWSQYELEVEEE